MYRLRHRANHHYILYALGLLALVVLVIGAWFGRTVFQPHTVITQSATVTRYVPATTEPTQHIDTSLFGLDLPAGWVSTAPPQTIYTAHSWHGGMTTADNARRLDVYTDTVPTNLAVNRLLPVITSGDHVNVTDAVSDNCVTFTDRTPDSQTSGVAIGKWGGINFLCDMINYERDVVATGSPEGVNSITLTGPITGKHRVLLVYTDNSSTANYTTFLNIVRSFRLH